MAALSGPLSALSCEHSSSFSPKALESKPSGSGIVSVCQSPFFGSGVSPSASRISQLFYRKNQGFEHQSLLSRKFSLKNVAPVLSALADIAQHTSAVDSSLPAGKGWVVHKFGGTCVGTSDRIKNVARIISEDASSKKFVVVSAMSKVTDMMYKLIDLAREKDESYLEFLSEIQEKHILAATDLFGDVKEEFDAFSARLEDDCQNLKAMLKAIYIAGNATDSFSDFVVGHGEIWSANMLAATIRKNHNAKCRWLDAREVLIVKPISGQQVDPDYEISESKIRDWAKDKASSYDIIVATGFIASTAEGIPTTLKRDGSDFSAAIFASLLRADKVTIWTDVDGVYSADPRKVKEAVILKSLSYQEAWEMSYFGANVLHPRTTLPVMKHNIPMVIRNVFNLLSPGTTICQNADCGTDEVPETEHTTAPFNSSSFDNVVKGFATIDNIALVNVEGTGMAGVPGTASEIFSAVKDVGANVIAISQASSEHSVCFAVPDTESNLVQVALEKRFQRALEVGRISKVEVIHNCSILAAVGQRMASTPGVSATLFSALAKANINVRAIAQGCSEYNITVIVNKEESVKALKAVHSRFYLSKTSVAVGLIGPGLIGGTLLDQFKDQASKLKEEFNIDFRVLGIVGSSKMLLSETGVELSDWKKEFSENGEKTDIQKFASHLADNNSIPNCVIVDCTASTQVAANYYDWLSNGIHIITPNKKANSGPLDQYLKLRELQRKSYTHYFYEATVGAGLPIVSTLRGLLETGDTIIKIEGIFSGTLSYIFNNFGGDKKFSEIVLEAKNSGYTEPDPRDDLSGTDVARKVIILARESGLRLELDDIPVESLVPEPLQSAESADVFLRELPNFDDAMEKLRSEAEEAGEVLRYVGVVDAHSNEGKVALRRYSKTHPFAQLSGSDNIIAFTTTRYNKQPLIVRGPGAGAEVTAGGVFCDLLRLASYLGAPS